LHEEQCNLTEKSVECYSNPHDAGGNLNLCPGRQPNRKKKIQKRDPTREAEKKIRTLPWQEKNGTTKKKRKKESSKWSDTS